MSTTMILGEQIVGSTCVRVLDVQIDGRWTAGCSRWSGRRLEVHYRAGTRDPRPGDELDVWVDGTTPYALAPRR